MFEYAFTSKSNIDIYAGETVRYPADAALASGKQAKRRLCSSKDHEAALASSSRVRRTMSKLPGNNAPRDWSNLVAFALVMVTGVLLIIFGHLTAAGLTTACAALAGVYGAWRHFR